MKKVKRWLKLKSLGLSGGSQSEVEVASRAISASLLCDITLIDGSLLFDYQFYIEQRAQDFVDKRDAILHYLQHGAKELLNPHPLFDTEFFVEQMRATGVVSKENPLVHFLKNGCVDRLDPHPLFKTDFYLSQNDDVLQTGTNPLSHYLESGAKEGRDPSPMFKTRSYAERFLLTSEVNALVHFVSVSVFYETVFARLFLARSQMSVEFISKGKIQLAKFVHNNPGVYSSATLWRLKHQQMLQKSTLFDVAFVREQLLQHDIPFATEAFSFAKDSGWIMEMYFSLWRKLDLKPHLLFDPAYYVADNPELDFEEIEPLTHYLLIGWKDGLNPHPLFDTFHYLKSNRDVSIAKINPLSHFVSHPELRAFSPFFDNFHYISGRRREKVAAAIELLTISGLRIWSRRKFAERSVRKLNAFGGVNPLIDFLSHQTDPTIFPNRNFRTLFQVQIEKIGPLGLRRFIRIVPKADVRRNPGLAILADCLRLRIGNTSFRPDANTVYLCAHEATRTGAPLLLLRLIQELVGRGKDCVVVLKRGGELEGEFSRYANVINLDVPQHVQLGTEACAKILACLFNDLGVEKPEFCILNSVETSGFAPAFKKHGVKSILLVHEVLDSYKQSFLDAGFAQCDFKIFPAVSVLEMARQKVRNELEGSIILPTAILNSQFADFDKAWARKSLRHEIGAKSESLIVLCCGSVELRKGLDVFYHTARQVLARFNQDVHFVWVGGSVNIIPHSIEYWVDWDIRAAKMTSKIHILKARPDLRVPFHGADVFFMPSRQDPFPCVAHDAMAADLPIVAFKNSGGVPDMLADGESILVEYGDITAAAEALQTYLSNISLRKKHAAVNQKLINHDYRFENFTTDLLTAIEDYLHPANVTECLTKDVLNA